MSFWIGFEKAAEATKAELKEVLRKHEERETPEQEAAESKEEQKIEREAGVEKHAAGRRPMASDVTNSPGLQMVIALNPDVQTSQEFVRRIDAALQSTSGLERMRFLVLNGQKDQAVINQLGLTIPGAQVYKQGKLVDKVPRSAQPSALTKLLGKIRSLV